MKAFLFDLDDTLVDTSKSFDEVVCGLVKKHSGRPTSREELFEMRSHGGFNCDWDATVELLRRRDVVKPRSEMAAEGLALYLELAREVEDMLVETSFLQQLAERHPVFIVTGRVRAEYAPVWGSRLDPLFSEVVCRDDRPHLAPKPSGDQLLDLMQRHRITGGYYVGNSVDDMRAGVAAGLTPIGVTTNQSEEVLRGAGARFVLPGAEEILGLLDRL